MCECVRLGILRKPLMGNPTISIRTFNSLRNHISVYDLDYYPSILQTLAFSNKSWEWGFLFFLLLKNNHKSAFTPQIFWLWEDTLLSTVKSLWRSLLCSFKFSFQNGCFFAHSLDSDLFCMFGHQQLGLLNVNPHDIEIPFQDLQEKLVLYPKQFS